MEVLTKASDDETRGFRPCGATDTEAPGGRPALPQSCTRLAISTFFQ